MALDSQQQAIEKTKAARNILLALPQNLNADILGSALVLSDFFQKQNKNPEIVCAQKVPERYLFLPQVELLKKDFTVIRDFIISIDTKEHKIARLRYENEKNLLKIFLSSPQKIEERNIHLTPGAFQYDLLVTVGATDLETLGELFEKNPDLFFEKPVLNIDDQAANEHFGEINLVVPEASCCAEIVLDFLQRQKVEIKTPAVATLLLAGIIEKTDSFQNQRTTPQALGTASLLIAAGANREEIVKHLYRTKPLALLKLWGRILAKINLTEEKNIISAQITPEDFSQTNTTSKILPQIMNELKDTFPRTNAASLFWTGGDGESKALFFSPKNTLRLKLEEFLATAPQGEYLLLSEKNTTPQKLETEINSLLAPLV
ncbi:MAG: hypothetical protein COU85_02860 [Candidatus Portnoybacteria bacterium CG10_big_fil_rev_8_21_14_0_10_44_7]|uniref:DDH domain-containing protein n=1 Tax=Candidatus Portnoybacteria bacterium CG10_big_fil_rev_8_21_14_0_10_44_7 TaxID=1974816 RepID=A0A2M8KI78_9BACT|nr:MAG: hypothetical protein COU85_02860 [Candidatus Portnoybacteria bacterium CG10_big_fil_rev_8_21_14_0_10_44_7]